MSDRRGRRAARRDEGASLGGCLFVLFVSAWAVAAAIGMWEGITGHHAPTPPAVVAPVDPPGAGGAPGPAGGGAATDCERDVAMGMIDSAILACDTNDAFVEAEGAYGTMNVKCALCFENLYRERCAANPGLAKTEICSLVEP